MELDQIVTEVFEEAGNKIAAGLGGMLGCDYEILAPTISLVTKKEFFNQTRKKQVMVRMSVTGDHEGDVYVFCRLKDAVQLGGTLIMLPPGELEERIKKELFGEEEIDSFGEIANIISGELCAAFEEVYPEKLHFKKVDLEAVMPSKVKIDDPEPFLPGYYLHIAYPATLDGKSLDEVILLFPAALLGIEAPEAPVEESPPQKQTLQGSGGRLIDPEEAAALLGDLAPDSAGATGIPVETSSAARRVEPGQPISMDEETDPGDKEPVILVVSIDGSYGQVLHAMIKQQGYNANLVDRKENFKDLSKTLRGRVKGLVLAMDEIGDQSFSVAIKVRTAFGESIPMMATGSQWTRSKVLQAVKYGVCDILLTPASEEEVLEKMEEHFSAGRNVAG